MSGTPAAYFEQMWSTGDDPWDHAGRWYERRKYDLTVACLPRDGYRRAFEPACGTGLLTERLLTRCSEVVASDRHPRAVEVTRRRCPTERLEVTEGAVPQDWPSGRFDLFVISEVLYYLDPHGVSQVLDRVRDTAEPEADLVCVHYRPRPEDHRLTGDEVHAILEGRTELERLVAHEEDEFLLGVWRLP